MRLRSRPMQPRDVRASVELLAGRELEGQRYGGRLEQLAAAWTRCLLDESLMAVVIEDLDRPSAGILVVGVSGFISEEFATHCKPLQSFGSVRALSTESWPGNRPFLALRQSAWQTPDQA
jgi:hypothetical protein